MRIIGFTLTGTKPTWFRCVPAYMGESEFLWILPEHYILTFYQEVPEIWFPFLLVVCFVSAVRFDGIVAEQPQDIHVMWKRTDPSLFQFLVSASHKWQRDIQKRAGRGGEEGEQVCKMALSSKSWGLCKQASSKQLPLDPVCCSAKLSEQLAGTRGPPSQPPPARQDHKNIGHA